MLRILITLLFLALYAPQAAAQMEIERAKPLSANHKSVELDRFNKVDISGAMIVSLVRIGEGETPRIAYDLKGNLSSRFDFRVDADSTLLVRERVTVRSGAVSDVTIYFNSLSSLSIARADVSCNDTFSAMLFDINLNSGGRFIGSVENADLRCDVANKSTLQLSGGSEYLSISCSNSSTCDLTAYDVNAAWAEASHSANITLEVKERLEVKAIMGGVVRYSGNPRIVRSLPSLIGGEVLEIK